MNESELYKELGELTRNREKWEESIPCIAALLSHESVKIQAMVVLSLEMYSKLTDPIEMALDKADYAAEHDSRRMTHDEIFGGIREKLNAK